MAVPVCTSNDVCGYSCGNGFVLDPMGNCACPSPYAVCGGQCKSSCPSSSVAPPPEGRSLPYGRAASRRRMCQRGYTACGITERRGRASEPWECVDIKNDLESCESIAVIWWNTV